MGKHKVVVGLGFGDEGKGTVVDHLTASGQYDFVLRFSGGPQAAHNVITDSGLHHTFSQFGSGSFNGIPTVLTKHMMINPLNMALESESLSEKIGYDAMNMMTISENCLLVTPWHRAINQLEEIRRGENAHGSCGQGVGITQKFALDYPDLALRAGDMLLDRDSFVAKATMVRELLKAEYGWTNKEEFLKLNGYVRTDFQRSPGNVHAMFETFMRDQMPIIVTDEEILNLIREFNCVWEGSQGALLDEWKGFHPYTTWSTTTAHKALQMLSEAGIDTETDVEVVGVTRSYHTRHGAGPFPSETPELVEEFPEPHNDWGTFQGSWRVGALDLSLLKYGVDVNERIDSIALTFMDREFILMVEPVDPDLLRRSGDLKKQERMTNYLMNKKRPGLTFEEDLDTIVRLVEVVTQTPVTLLSYGPKTGDKKIRVAVS